MNSFHTHFIWASYWKHNVYLHIFSDDVIEMHTHICAHSIMGVSLDICFKEKTSIYFNLHQIWIVYINDLQQLIITLTMNYMG